VEDEVAIFTFREVGELDDALKVGEVVVQIAGHRQRAFFGQLDVAAVALGGLEVRLSRFFKKIDDHLRILKIVFLAGQAIASRGASGSSGAVFWGGWFSHCRVSHGFYWYFSSILPAFDPPCGFAEQEDLR